MATPWETETHLRATFWKNKQNFGFRNKIPKIPRRLDSKIKTGMEIHYELKGTNQPKTAIVVTGTGGAAVAERHTTVRPSVDPTTTTQYTFRA